MRSEPHVVELAKAWLGTPYLHQCSALGAGCDCLGLLRGIWRALYGAEPEKLPPYSADWRDAQGAPALLAAARRHLIAQQGSGEPGQVLLFCLYRGLPPKHCGVLTAPDRFIHAQERLGVIETALTPVWRRRVAGVFSFPPIA